MSRIRFVVSMLLARALFGQASPGGPEGGPGNSVIRIQRTPATPASESPKTGTFVDQFDFGANVRALANSMQPSPEVGAPPTAAHGQPAVRHSGYHAAPTDVTLSPTAQQAVEFSASWRAQQNGAAPGPDGRVLFAFGAGLPTVVCAPLRVCLIELQPGEKTRWRTADRRFCPVERGPCQIRERRRKYRNAGAEAADAGPRYKPSDYD